MLGVTRQQLKTGDVVVQANGLTFLIELKSVNNLVSDHIASGIYGGVSRFSTERARLAGEQEVHGAAVRSLLLLWGVRPALDDCRVGVKGNFTGKNFATSLQRTSFAAGVAVWHAGNTLDDAAIYIALIVSNLESGKLARDGVVIDSEAAPPSLVRKQHRDAPPAELLTSMLAALPGMSKPKATAVVHHVETLTGLVTITLKDLAKVEVAPDRKLGPALAKRIKALC